LKALDGFKDAETRFFQRNSFNNVIGLMVLNNYATVFQDFIFCHPPLKGRRKKERNQNKNESKNALNLTLKKRS